MGSCGGGGSYERGTPVIQSRHLIHYISDFGLDSEPLRTGRGLNATICDGRDEKFIMF